MIEMEEGGGIEPLAVTPPWFSRPVAGHSAAPSREGWRWVQGSNLRDFRQPWLSKPVPYLSVNPPEIYAEVLEDELRMSRIVHVVDAYLVGPRTVNPRAARPCRFESCPPHHCNALQQSEVQS